MPEHPFHPRFSAAYAKSFKAHRKRLGLGGENFEFFLKDVEDHLCDYPWEYSREIPDSQGLRMLRTREAFEDIPPLYVYFRVDNKARCILFLGLSEAWSAAEQI